MSTHKHFDRICALAAAVCLFVTLLMYSAPGLGIQPADTQPGYESRLFSTDSVHTIDIAIDDWDAFLSTAQSEEYTVCDVTVDGELIPDVGIRGKGNTSLSQVAAMNSQRYSFKVEFDRYDSTRSYHGLDKLCLNNLIQDNTMMKDYLTYQMMLAFGVEAPLCSFAYITVNGEDWGLYLAVEAIEDSFLRRSYGSGYGELYKPDSMSMGGGRGNGREFDMNDWQEQRESGSGEASAPTQTFPGDRGGNRRQSGGMAEDSAPPAGQMPGNFDPSAMFEDGKGGGMGSSDVKLQYIDDDPDSYANIFDSAKTDITSADKTRLIRSLEALSQMDSSAVNIEAVIRYFVVHNYVVNGDSYTGSMIHNYYLYEEDGLLSMLPWDYNLAFGGFQGGSAAASVNDDIDAPLSCSGSGDRPMMDWLLQGDRYTLLYHSFFSDFLDSVDPQAIIDEAYSLIVPHVKQDPTRFCTVEAFEAGVDALKTFCSLRTQSVRSQLTGDDTPVSTGDLDLSAMGSMNMGGDFDRSDRGTFPAQQPGQQMPDMSQTTVPGQPTTAAPQTGGLLPLAISVVVLLLGLLAVFQYRR